jgi:hypothetical protein
MPYGLRFSASQASRPRWSDSKVHTEGITWLVDVGVVCPDTPRLLAGRSSTCGTSTTTAATAAADAPATRAFDATLLQLCPQAVSSRCTAGLGLFGGLLAK